MKADLLLVPGLLCDARLWRDQIGPLSGPARPVIAETTLDDAIDAMARRALAAMPGRFALAGLSMGGYVALAIMRLAPERVTRLLLMSTSAQQDTPQQARRRRGLIDLVAREPAERFRGVTPRLLPQLVHPDRVSDAVLSADIAAMAARVGRDGFLRQQRAIAARPDSLDLLPQLRLPSLVVVGDADQLTPPELSRTMAAAIPGARLEVLRDCGHLPPMEHPDIVTALLRTWLG